MSDDYEIRQGGIITSSFTHHCGMPMEDSHDNYRYVVTKGWTDWAGMKSAVVATFHKRKDAERFVKHMKKVVK